MHCFVLSSPAGADVWQMRRSVEIIGYHRHAKEARILFFLHIDNLLASGQSNYLSVLHRGNTECATAPAWPLPSHPDETGESGDCILSQVYGRLFHADQGRLFQVNALSAWDEYRQTAPQQILPWTSPHPPADVPRATGEGQFSQGVDPGEGYVPFTTWRLGPFTERASYLIAFTMTLRGATYEELTERYPEFTIDGPDRVLSRIKYHDLLNLRDDERSEWGERLRPFEDSPVLPGEGYDLILLGSPSADDVEPLVRSSISLAPLQPERRNGRHAARFVSTCQRFTMSMRYAEGAGVPNGPSLLLQGQSL